MQDIEDKLLRLNSGKTINQDEIDCLIKFLFSITKDNQDLQIDNIYSSLYFLRKYYFTSVDCGDCRGVFQKFIDISDITTKALVLETLCLDWGLHDEVLDQLFQLIIGVNYDEENELKNLAFKLLNEGIISGKLSPYQERIKIFLKTIT